MASTSTPASRRTLNAHDAPAFHAGSNAAAYASLRIASTSVSAAFSRSVFSLTARACDARSCREVIPGSLPLGLSHDVLLLSVIGGPAGDRLVRSSGTCPRRYGQRPGRCRPAVPSGRPCAGRCDPIGSPRAAVHDALAVLASADAELGAKLRVCSMVHRAMSIALGRVSVASWGRFRGCRGLLRCAGRLVLRVRVGVRVYVGSSPARSRIRAYVVHRHALDLVGREAVELSCIRCAASRVSKRGVSPSVTAVSVHDQFLVAGSSRGATATARYRARCGPGLPVAVVLAGPRSARARLPCAVLVVSHSVVRSS